MNSDITGDLCIFAWRKNTSDILGKLSKFIQSVFSATENEVAGEFFSHKASIFFFLMKIELLIYQTVSHFNAALSL